MATDNFTGNPEQNNKAWTPEEMAQIESDTMDFGIFAERIYEQIEASPPILTKDQVQEIEKLIKNDAIRRTALFLASMSGAETCKKIADDREFAVATAGIYSELPALQERYQALVSLFEDLNKRLMVALCSREDLQEIEAEGKEMMMEQAS
jgi:DNA primase catalytic subunit